jgi:hypothetical protein
VEITYVPPIPEEHETALVDGVREASQQHGGAIQRHGCERCCRVHKSESEPKGSDPPPPNRPGAIAIFTVPLCGSSLLIPINIVVVRTSLHS